MNNNNRGRFPPGIGAVAPDPNFQLRNPNPQQLQTQQSPTWNQQQPDAQHYGYPQNNSQQIQQQQQWSRRVQLAGDPSYVDEVEKTVQSEANNDSK